MRVILILLSSPAIIGASLRGANFKQGGGSAVRTTSDVLNHIRRVMKVAYRAARIGNTSRREVGLG